MSVTPPGRRSSSPRWLAGRRSAARGDDCVERHVEVERDRGRREDVGQIAEPEERRAQPRTCPPACGHRRRMPSSPRSPPRGLDVGRRLDAERHDAAGERADARHRSAGRRRWPRARVRRGVLEDLGLGVGDRIRRGEEPEVRVADVGPDADVRLRDADERPDLAGMIHAELDHCHLRSGPQLEQRERQADVVVQVPLVPEHPVASRQELRRDFLRRRLAGAAGDRDDPGCRTRRRTSRRDVLQSRAVVSATRIST